MVHYKKYSGKFNYHFIVFELIMNQKVGNGLGIFLPLPSQKFVEWNLCDRLSDTNKGRALTVQRFPKYENEIFR
jgi:hypothetical protein